MSPPDFGLDKKHVLALPARVLYIWSCNFCSPTQKYQLILVDLSVLPEIYIVFIILYNFNLVQYFCKNFITNLSIVKKN